MTTATITILPATQAQTIESTYKVKGYAPRQGQDSIQFDATIWEGNKKVAHVSNSGNGGSHLFYFETREDEEKFNKFVAQHTWTWGQGYDMEFTHDIDSVFRLFAEEFYQTKWLNSTAKRKKGFIAAEKAKDITEGQFFVYTDAARIPAGYLVWNGSNWDTK